jgi:hypothetical protein
LHALDGLDFIIGTIGTKIVPGQTVIVNLSWGPQTGPHDGSSLLEQALQQRVLDQLGLNRMLLIALPAGNSYAARAHAQFAANEGCEELIWRVPPGHRAPSFLEFWWPAGTDPTDARLEVLAPDGLEFGLGVDDGNSAFVEPGSSASLTRVVHAERPMVLLALAPTDGAEHRAPHGAWRIRVLPVAGGAPDPVHVYVARQSANMGARRRGPDSHLFDPRYEQERQHALFPGEVADSRVRREGTLNGLATGALTVVTGGSVLNRSHLGGDRAMAPYSSSGPGSGPGGRNPNVAAACDESPLLRGLRASGVRPGTSVRLVGTSVAAPQVGRKLARLVSGESSIDAPAPTVPANPRRAGAGILTPMNLPGVPEPHAAGASWQDALSSWLADTPTTP